MTDSTNCIKEKILIVDDTPANIDVLGGILVRDYDISVAISGHMALDIVHSGETPDLILLDIMMPEMDGYEVARRLKADQATSHIPIIFVTAKIDDADEAVGFEVGAVDYIRKPVNAPITLARIKSQLELKQYRDQLARMVEKKTDQVKHSQKALVEEKQKLHHQAFHDALTGIANRRYFTEQLNTLLEMQKKKPGFRCAVLLIDLDRFKNVNDSLGHQAGDQLLKMVAEKIKQCLRNNDLLARLGGDEFAILLSDVDSDELISAIAERITQAAASPFMVSGQEIRISASIGVVTHTQRYDTANSLIRDADLAMYHAKDSGKAQFQFFSNRMRESALTCLTIETELRKALERRELVLYFQPIIDIASDTLEGFEALIRWHHPSRGLVPPDQFIPIAEETGLILPIGDWVIGEGCRKLVQIKEKTGQLLTMNLNVSIKQFLQNDFVDKLECEIAKAGLTPQNIKLEFTESLLMKHTQQAVKKLYALRDLGVKLAIDDFGTGYSSLSYLQQFPIDQIKIDRSFIKAMDNKEESRKIVKSILALAKSLNISAVAEGVETRSQLDQLSHLSCGSGQGYFIAKPMPWEDLYDFIVQYGKK